MTYTNQYVLAVCIAVAAGFLGLVQVADPIALGISPKFVAWAGILSSTLVILQGFLPKLNKPNGE